MTTTLYRFRSSKDVLLYVGIADEPTARIRQHFRDKDWWPDVAHISFDVLACRAEAQEAERRAIQTERPLHNVVFNRGTMREATEAAARAEPCGEDGEFGETPWPPGSELIEWQCVGCYEMINVKRTFVSVGNGYAAVPECGYLQVPRSEWDHRWDGIKEGERPKLMKWEAVCAACALERPHHLRFRLGLVQTSRAFMQTFGELITAHGQELCATTNFGELMRMGVGMFKGRWLV